MNAHLASNMLQIVNRQRKIGIDAAKLLKFAEQAAGLIPAVQGGDFTVAFVSDQKMRRLNGTFRGKNTTTDVLSFPWQESKSAPDSSPIDWSTYLGDIVISAEQAQKQASANNLSLDIEINQLILHGILHLCGFDHDTDNGEMNALELELRDKLLIS